MLALFRAKFACILAILHTLKLEQFIPCQISNRECEELLKFVQRSRDSRLDLTGGSRLQATRMMHTCQACQKSKRRASCCTTGQKSQAGQAVCSRLELATQPSRKVKPPEHLIWQNMTFHIPSHPTIYIPLYPRFKQSFQREF